MRTPTTDGRRVALPDHLQEHLSEWVDHQLLNPGEAARIGDYERALAKPRRISAVAEIVGYLGALLILVGGGSLYVQERDAMSHVVRVAVPAFGALAALVGGIFLIRTSEFSFRRLGAVLWMISVGLVAGAIAVALVDTPVIVPQYTAFVVGAASLVYAVILYRLCKHEATQAAMFAAAVTTLAGVIAWVNPQGDNAQIWFAVPLVALGLAWVIAGATSVVVPRTIALVLGSFLALYMPQLIAGTNIVWMAFVLGLAVAGGLLAASTWLRSTPVLVLSAIGLFMYLVGVITQYLSDTVGAPLALLLSGVALLAVALGASRLQRFTRRNGPEEPEG